MTARAEAPKAIFGESQEHDAVRLLMFVYIAMFDDEATARDVPTWPTDEIRQRFQLLAKVFRDAATDTAAMISSIESWTFNCQIPLIKLCEQLEALKKPRFQGDVVQIYYKWDEMRLAAGAFCDSGLENACIGVGQALSSLAVLRVQVEEMMTSLRLRDVQATANMVRRRDSIGHGIGDNLLPDKAQKLHGAVPRAPATHGKTRKLSPVVFEFEDWELVAILTVPSISAGGITAELTAFRSLYYKASCFLERSLIQDCQFVIAVHEANRLEYDKLAQMMDKLTIKCQQSIKSLQCLLKIPWSFHAPLQWQFDSLAKHDCQLHVTLQRAECFFVEWQGAMRTITNPILKKASTGLGREIITMRLALSAVDKRHQKIRRKVEGLWAIRVEFTQGRIRRGCARERMNKVLSVEELKGTVKIYDDTVLLAAAGLEQLQECSSAGSSCSMAEACLTNLTNPQHKLRELGKPNLMTHAEALAALLVEHTGQSQGWKPESVIQDSAELQRRYEANVDVFHFLFPDAEKPEFAQDVGIPPAYTDVPSTQKQVRWNSKGVEANDESDDESGDESDGE